MATLRRLTADTFAEAVDSRLAQLTSASRDGQDPEETLLLCAQEIRMSVEYQRRIEEIRDAAAQALRDQQVPMTRIARLAGVSDSYLARRLFARGSARKTVRQQGRRAR